MLAWFYQAIVVARQASRSDDPSNYSSYTSIESRQKKQKLETHLPLPQEKWFLKKTLSLLLFFRSFSLLFLIQT